ncbi:MAG TPA: transglutaminase [Flavobacterium sp.]
MNKKYLLLIAILLSPLFVKAQRHELNKVTVAELSEKIHPLDTAASAAILFKKGEVKFTIDGEGYWKVQIETTVKMKIYKTDGYKYANVEEVFYAGVHKDQVQFYDAATYNLVDGKVEKTKLASESKFSEEKNKYYSAKKITLPNVREGSIIEYKIIRTTYNTIALPDFFMQYDVPANFVSYSVTVPEYFIYNKLLGGFLQPKRADEYVNKVNSYSEHRSIFTLTDVKAMRDEAFVDNIDNYRSRLIYELATRIDGNGMRTELATTWESVARKIYENDDFGPELKKTGYFEADLDALLQGASTKREKINKVFGFVQSKMSWNEYLGYSCSEGVKSAYKNSTGNVGEINLMLIAMLRYAKVDADPVLVSTRANGITMYPSRTGYNYVICGAMDEDGMVLLDATSKVNSPGILPTRALNWLGRVIKPNNSSSLVELNPTIKSIDAVNIMVNMAADGTATGKLRNQYTNYNAYRFRDKYLDLSEESYLQKLEDRYKGMMINDYKVENSRELLQPIVETYSFSYDNLTEIIGDKMYFSPMMFLTSPDNPFKQETREYPVDFVFPSQDKYAISIKLPDGYVVESMPAPVQINMNDNMGSFRYNITHSGNQVQLVVMYDMNTAIVGQEHYDTLKKFFSAMIAKQTEKIVLKKV